MQAECLRAAAAKMPSEGAKIVLALDNDDGGRMIAKRLRDILQSVDLPIVDHFPPQNGHDWNDVLLDRRKYDPRALRYG